MAYIDHVHIHASDAAKTIKFFEDHFGARIDKEFENLGRKLTILVIGDLSRLSVLHIPPVEENPKPESASIDHIGIVVEDIAAVVSGIKAEGYVFPVDISPSSTGSTIAFCLGPDNVYLEIIERPK
jgi:catechol 2,3-dioxygenase-like lactoylglutathione lyase family enzyme